MLIILGLISKALAQKGIEITFKEVMKRIKKKDKTNDEIREIIAGYWFVSKALKKKLREYIDMWGDDLSAACTSLVFTRHMGSPACDQAACFRVSFSSIGTTGGSFFFPRASRSAWAGVRPLRR